MKRARKQIKKKPAKTRAKKKARAAPRRRKGLMFVLSSPSGAGKTTLARMLLEDEKGNVELSVSVTTRPKRASEIEGRHYHFIDRRRFEEMVKRGALLEWAEVHGNLYGTPRVPVERFLRAGKDVLFDIDWQGTLQLYRAARADVVGVFVLPPSAQELRARIARRAEDSQEVIQRRLKNAVDELEHWREYDYVVVNDDLGAAYGKLRSILAAERLRRGRARGAKAGGAPADAEKLRRDAEPRLPGLVKKIQTEL